MDTVVLCKCLISWLKFLNMFFILSKTVPHLVMPFTIIVLSLVSALFIKDRKWKKRLSVFGIVCLLFFSNRIIVDQVMKFWEIPPTPIALLPNKEKVGIVLTGVVKKEKNSS